MVVRLLLLALGRGGSYAVGEGPLELLLIDAHVEDVGGACMHGVRLPAVVLGLAVAHGRLLVREDAPCCSRSFLGVRV